MDKQSPQSHELSIRNLSKIYDESIIVNSINIDIPEGEFFAILGPSGCGKTTTLRMIAGLEIPSSGTINLGGENITSLPPYKRNVNTVFQNYALFPHMTVEENVAFGLRRRGIKNVEEPVKKMLEMIQLPNIGSRKPSGLSGGQQQRIAIARALINEPGVLLLDEPLGALDLKLRREMQYELKRIQEEVGITFIHVTHDQEEALTLADRVAVMNAGSIEQLSDPYTLYDNPETIFVANFLGKANFFQGKYHDEVLEFRGSKAKLPAQRLHASTREIYIGVRPEKIRIGYQRDELHTDFWVAGKIIAESFNGVATEYIVQSPGIEKNITVFTQNDGYTEFDEGDEVFLGWDSKHAFVFDRDEADQFDAEQLAAELMEGEEDD